MKVTVSHPNYPTPIVYDERLIRWVLRLAAGKATLEDAEAAQQAAAETPEFPVCIAVQATMESMAGMIRRQVEDTVFHVDLDRDGKVDLTIEDVGEFMRYVSGKAGGKLKKESGQYQAIVAKMTELLE